MGLEHFSLQNDDDTMTPKKKAKELKKITDDMTEEDIDEDGYVL